MQRCDLGHVGRKGRRLRHRKRVGSRHDHWVVADPAGLFCWLEASHRSGSLAPTFRGRKAVAGAPMCEQ